MSAYLALLETDGSAYGGHIPELQVSVVGTSLDEVRLRLAQGAALALERLGAVPARARSLEDLPADVREAFRDLDVQVEFLEPRHQNPGNESPA